MLGVNVTHKFIVSGVYPCLHINPCMVKGVILPPDHFRRYNYGTAKDTEMPFGDFVSRSMAIK